MNEIIDRIKKAFNSNEPKNFCDSQFSRAAPFRFSEASNFDLALRWTFGFCGSFRKSCALCHCFLLSIVLE